MFFNKPPQNRLRLTGETRLNTSVGLNNLEAGKVTLVEFWTFGCINCQNTIPPMQELWRKFHSKANFQFIGVHRPEFDYEHKIENVVQAIAGLGITWPVLIDNDYSNWDKFKVHYWPSFFIFDRYGKMVHSQIGEGNYDVLNDVIGQLIADTSEI